MQQEPVHLCSYLLGPHPSSSSLLPPPPADHHAAHRLPFIFTCVGGGRTTVAEVRRRVCSLSAALSSSAGLGISIGDRVCTLALATPTHLEALLAISAAGGIAVPLNWRWTSSEAAYAVSLVEASALIFDAANLLMAQRIMQTCPDLKTFVILDGMTPQSLPRSLHSFISSSQRLLLAEDAIVQFSSSTLPLSTDLKAPDDDAAFIIFTSGTTGSPRAAVLSHSALHFQCGAKLDCCGYSASDVYLHAAQLFHVGGLCSALAMLRAGAHHVFLPMFKADACMAAIEEHGVTSFIAVPTMVADLVLAAGTKEGRSIRTLNSVRSVLVGAGGLSPTLLRSLQALLPNAQILSAYGMTEACSSLTFRALSSMNDASPQAGAVPVGRPPPGIDLAILKLPTPCSPPSETEIPSGVVFEGSGEVLTRGPHVMMRYWNDPAATSGAFLSQGGWFRTGDLGTLSTGELGLLGRAKDVVKSGGENVAAAEVERALATHPAVAAVAVVGLPDARLGELVAAAVVLRPEWRDRWRGPDFHEILIGRRAAGDECGNAARSDATAAAFDGAELQRHCRSEGLAGFKLPRAVAVVAELPTNATGKVLKPAVREAMLKLREENLKKGAAPIRARL